MFSCLAWASSSVYCPGRKLMKRKQVKTTYNLSNSEIIVTKSSLVLTFSVLVYLKVDTVLWCFPQTGKYCQKHFYETKKTWPVH